MHDLGLQEICGHTYYWNIDGMMYNWQLLTSDGSLKVPDDDYDAPHAKVQNLGG